jgi:hypothetical protein
MNESVFCGSVVYKRKIKSRRKYYLGETSDMKRQVSRNDGAKRWGEAAKKEVNMNNELETAKLSKFIRNLNWINFFVCFRNFRLEEKLCIISEITRSVTKSVNVKGAAEGSHGASTEPAQSTTLTRAHLIATFK